MGILDELSFHQILLIAVGAAFLLLGWLLYWASIQISGAMLLGGVGLLLGGVAGKALGLDEQVTLIAAGIAALLGAILGLLAARFLHLAGFFLVGCCVGASVFYTLVTNWRGGGAPPHEFLASDIFFAFGIPVAAGLGGILAVVFSDLLIIWCGAVLGAALIMQGLGWPMAGLPALPIVVVGGAMQLALTRPFRSRPAKEDE